MMTEADAKRLQAWLGVTQDGKIGPVTLAALWRRIEPEIGIRTLTSPAAFYERLRAVTGPLDQEQVNTINHLLTAGSTWSTSWMAYALATAWHEARLKPIEEYGKGKGKAYGKAGRHGQSQHGRGLVQLTWDENYERADEELDLGGELVADFDKALEPEIAVAIMIKGMAEGWFTGKSLSDYLPRELANGKEFEEARRIINGTDRKVQIADYAMKIQDALLAGGWK